MVVSGLRRLLIIFEKAEEVRAVFRISVRASTGPIALDRLQALKAPGRGSGCPCIRPDGPPAKA